MEIVIVERVLTQPVDADAVNALGRTYGWCQDIHRIRHLRSYLSRDGLRLICVYEARDAESVRRYNRQTGFPAERIWSAKDIAPYEADKADSD